MLQTLHAVKREAICVKCDFDGIGFPDSKLIIDLNGPAHQKIISSNVVIRNDKGVLDGVIVANPDILNMEPPQRKAVLGREWIEVMLEIDRGSELKSTISDDRIEMALMFNSLGLRSPWQDSTEFDIEVDGALRELMVSKESILELLEQLSLSIGDLRRLIANDPIQGSSEFRRLIQLFSSRHSVEISLVQDRFQEVLWAQD